MQTIEQTAEQTAKQTTKQTVEQWAYGALLNYWPRWSATRSSVRRTRPRRAGSRTLAFALAAAASMAPPRLR